MIIDFYSGKLASDDPVLEALEESLCLIEFEISRSLSEDAINRLFVDGAEQNHEGE